MYTLEKSEDSKQGLFFFFFFLMLLFRRGRIDAPRESGNARNLQDSSQIHNTPRFET